MLRRTRAIFGLGGLWGAGLGVVAGVLRVILGSWGPGALIGGSLWNEMFFGSVIGFVSGVGFAMTLAVLETGTRLEELRAPRAMLAGFVGGALGPLIAIAMSSGAQAFLSLPGLLACVIAGVCGGCAGGGMALVAREATHDPEGLASIRDSSRTTLPLGG